LENRHRFLFQQSEHHLFGFSPLPHSVLPSVRKMSEHPVFNSVRKRTNRFIELSNLCRFYRESVMVVISVFFLSLWIRITK
jgi:hypothetical protein